MGPRCGWWLALGLILGLLGGCGKKMAPIPPDSLTPGMVREFQVGQEGTGVLLTWQMPRVNIEGQPLTAIQGFRVYRAEDSLGAGGCPPELGRLIDIDLAYPVAGEIQGEAVAYRDVELTPGRRYFYQVIGYDRGGGLGEASAVLSQVWEVLPQAPEQVAAKAGDRLVTLRWAPVRNLSNGQPVPGRVTYQVFRQEAGAALLRVNPQPLEEPQFADVSAANDVTYSYRVRAVRPVEKSFLESLDSAAVTARPEDLTPPAPVQNLVAVRTGQGIELRWEAGTEKDLAGYRVYRRGLSEAGFQSVQGGLLSQAYFVDTQVRPGGVYYYYVTAVDNSRRANESLPSEGVEVVVR